MDKICAKLYPLMRDYLPAVPADYLRSLLLPQFQQMRRALAVETYLQERRELASPEVYPDIWCGTSGSSFGVRFFDKSNKEQELKYGTAKYKQLHEKAAHLECRCPKDGYASDCEKCDLLGQARGMKILVHEEPLSRLKDEVKATVFEIHCPHGFSCWRDISWMRVHDLGREQTKTLNASQKKVVEHDLLEYSKLKKWSQDHKQRVGLGSTTKSWLRTHYNLVSFPIELDKVCLNNALQLRLIDRQGSLWIEDQESKPSLDANLESVITDDRYSSLTRFASSSSHSENEVFASQDACHPQLYLNEFIASGLLRAGERTQWYNIRAAWQLGTQDPDSNSARRLTHTAFIDNDFCGRMLEQLGQRLNSIETNWKEQDTLATIVNLSLRTLTLSEDSESIEGAIVLLYQAREVALRWYDQLSKLLDSDDSLENPRYRNGLIRAGNTCLATYDVESRYLEHLLASHQIVEKRLSELIRNEPTGINAAVERSIEAVSLNGSWEEIGVDTAIVMKKFGQLVIPYDLLTGELLVDGRPPGRLPKSYTQLGLMPDSFRNGGRQSLHNGPITDQLLQLVPPQTLNGDVPAVLAAEYYHWLNFETNTIEFRPVKDKWQSSMDYWHLILDFELPKRCAMSCRDRKLIDVRSPLYRQITGTLKALDTPEHMLITQSVEENILVELVRLRIHFFINDAGLLECRELAAIVNPDQNIGCFYGFQSKLVLKSLAGSGTTRRSVLVPYGRVRVSQARPHVLVTIEHDPHATRVKYFRYRLDEHLQTLQGPEDMLSNLYRCYLHAVTGYACLKVSAALDPKCKSVLTILSALTPRRTFYPEHLQVMQTVHWKPYLGQLVQHDDFLVVVEEILQHASMFTPFNTHDSDCMPELCSAKTKLLARARNINARRKNAEFGGAISRRHEDLVYKARDADYSSESGKRVYQTAALIRDWPSQVNHADIMTEAEGWDEVCRRNLYESCTEKYSLRIEKVFGSLYDFCRHSTRESNTYRLTSHFCMLAFANKNNQSLIRTFLLIAFSGKLDDFPIPSEHSLGMTFPFAPSKGEHLISTAVKEALKSHCIGSMNPFISEQRHNDEVTATIDKYLNEILAQWPFEKEFKPASFPTLSSLMSSVSPKIKFTIPPPISASRDYNMFIYSYDCSELGKLITPFQEHPNPKWKRYGQDLLESIDGLSHTKVPNTPREISLNCNILIRGRDHLIKIRNGILEEIRRVIAPKPDSELWIAYTAKFWPSMLVKSLLPYLSYQKFQELSQEWKDILVTLDVVIFSIQRYERLLSFLKDNNVLEFYKESENPGRCGWDVMENSAWILFEIENNLTIREDQAKTAFQMICFVLKKTPSCS
ncbi:hypothetical protein FQN57_002109 [Myotisia sp. PD_48]|nr:hypothetical protein FQN57_002109 [Myotisia sp. PD_48]